MFVDEVADPRKVRDLIEPLAHLPPIRVSPSIAALIPTFLGAVRFWWNPETFGRPPKKEHTRQQLENLGSVQFLHDCLHHRQDVGDRQRSARQEGATC